MGMGTLRRAASTASVVLVLGAAVVACQAEPGVQRIYMGTPGALDAGEILACEEDEVLHRTSIPGPWSCIPADDLAD